jgi:hypothetical protein
MSPLKHIGGYWLGCSCSLCSVSLARWLMSLCANQSSLGFSGPVDDSALRSDVIGDLRVCACLSSRDSTQKVEHLGY